MSRHPVVWRFGACQLRTLRRELTVNGVRHTLAPKVFELLLLLLRHRARVVTRGDLRDALWPATGLSDSVLARTVMKLRRAIGDDDRQRPLIQSVRGVGYLFAAQVQREGPEDATAGSCAVPPEPSIRTRAPAPGFGHGDALTGAPPFANATGAAQRACVRVGPMSLAGDTPVADERPAKAVDPAICSSGQRTLAFVCGDAFLRQAFARGTGLFRLDRWREAQCLFDVVYAAEPDNLVALAAQAQNLALLEDPRAEDLAKLLLRRAIARQESELQAQAHALIAYAVAQRCGDTATCVAHCKAARRLSATDADEDWVIWHRINQATRALLDDDFSKALELFGEAEAASRASGNAYRLSQLQMHMYLLDFSAGKPPKARERMGAASSAHRRPGHRRSPIQALSLLALLNASLGPLDPAFAHCDVVVGEVDSLRSPGSECSLLAAAARVCAERGAAA